MNARRFAVRDLVRIPAPDGTEVILVRGTEKSFVLPKNVADVISACIPFCTIDDHARAIGQRIGAPASGIAKLSELITEFVDAGLLIELRASPSVDREPRVLRVLGCVTRERPDVLVRSIRSYVECARRFGREIDVVVADDTPEDGALDATIRARTGDLARELQTSLAHVGAAEKRALAAALIRDTGVDADILEFALFDPFGVGTTIGANRNALALFTAGELMLSADDDTVCRPIRAPEARDALVVSAERDPQEYWFYPDIEGALATPEDRSIDVFGEHERLLGGGLQSFISGALDDDALRGICPHLVSAYAGEQGAILSTPSGIYGDSGMYAGTALLSLTGASRDRLLDPATYRMAFTSRALLRAVCARTITHPFGTAGTVFGIDGRSLVPPFMPVGRNEDGVFGTTVGVCFEDMYYGFPAHAVAHVPGELRRFEGRRHVDAAREVRWSQLLIALMLDYGARACEVEPSARLCGLGRHLVEVGALPARDLRAYVQLAYARMRQRSVEPFLSRLEEHRAMPPQWADDVRTVIEGARQSVLGSFWAPIDLSPSHTEDAPALLGRLIAAMGRLFSAWPTLFAAARRLGGKAARRSLSAR